jgi:hypothetical protein
MQLVTILLSGEPVETKEERGGQSKLNFSLAELEFMSENSDGNSKLQGEDFFLHLISYSNANDTKKCTDCTIG